MSITKKIITSAVAGSVAGVLANLFVNRKKADNSATEKGKSKKGFTDSSSTNSKDDVHYFV